MAKVREDTGRPVRTRYIHQDHLGSPVAETDASGAVLWREAYTPYGEKWGENPTPSGWGTQDQPGFTGHFEDEDTGLVYMQARFYDPVGGRFLSNDPVTFGPMGSGDLHMFGRYGYVHGDPVNLTDPTGMCPWCVAGAFINGGMQLYREGKNGTIGRNASLGSNLRAIGRVGLASGTGALGVGTGARILGVAKTQGGRLISGAAGGGVGSAIAETGAQAGEMGAGRATAGEAAKSIGRAGTIGAVIGGPVGRVTSSGVSQVDELITAGATYGETTLGIWNEAQAAEAPGSGVTMQDIVSEDGGGKLPVVDLPCVGNAATC